MNRREAFKATALLVGGAIVGGSAFLSGCSSLPQGKQASFSPDDILLLDEVGATIIPTTPDSPGAKAAHIGAFMATIVADCYDEKEQKVFSEGLIEVKEASKMMFGKGFIALSPEEKKTFLSGIDKKSKEHDKLKAETDAVHFFTMMKQLTVWGYFTSQPGVTKALRYVPVPGRYEGCIPYTAGERAWAP